MKVKDLIKQLQTNYNLEEEVAYDLWSKEDIVTICDDFFDEKEVLPDGNIHHVLEKASDEVDANKGLTWCLFEGLIRDEYHEIGDMNKKKGA